MIDKLIFDILNENGKATVPSLGTFFKKQLNIMFLPYLKTDNGEFIKSLTNSLSVTTDMAQEILTSYIATIDEIIASTGQYILKDMGTLTRDLNGLISYQSGVPTATNKPVAVISKPSVSNITSPSTANNSTKTSTNDSLADNRPSTLADIMSGKGSNKTFADMASEKKKL